MGGKIWSPAEEKVFWREVIPHSPKRVGLDRAAHAEKKWDALAAEMQTALGEDARREYTGLCLFEHFFQNAVNKRFSPNAAGYVAKYLKTMGRSGQTSLIMQPPRAVGRVPISSSAVARPVPSLDFHTPAVSALMTSHPPSSPRSLAPSPSPALSLDTHTAGTSLGPTMAEPPDTISSDPSSHSSPRPVLPPFQTIMGPQTSATALMQRDPFAHSSLQRASLATDPLMNQALLTEHPNIQHGTASTSTVGRGHSSKAKAKDKDNKGKGKEKEKTQSDSGAVSGAPAGTSTPAFLLPKPTLSGGIGSFEQLVDAANAASNREQEPGSGSRPGTACGNSVSYTSRNHSGPSYYSTAGGPLATSGVAGLQKQQSPRPPVPPFPIPNDMMPNGDGHGTMGYARGYPDGYHGHGYEDRDGYGYATRTDGLYHGAPLPPGTVRSMRFSPPVGAQHFSPHPLHDLAGYGAPPPPTPHGAHQTPSTSYLKPSAGDFGGQGGRQNKVFSVSSDGILDRAASQSPRAASHSLNQSQNQGQIHDQASRTDPIMRKQPSSFPPPAWSFPGGFVHPNMHLSPSPSRVPDGSSLSPYTAYYPPVSPYTPSYQRAHPYHGHRRSNAFNPRSPDAPSATESPRRCLSPAAVGIITHSTLDRIGEVGGDGEGPRGAGAESARAGGGDILGAAPFGYVGL